MGGDCLIGSARHCVTYFVTRISTGHCAAWRFDRRKLEDAKNDRFENKGALV